MSHVEIGMQYVVLMLSTCESEVKCKTCGYDRCDDIAP